MSFASLLPLRASTLALSSSVIAALLVAPGLVRPARACGGFWCSLDAPVNQTAERIVFVDNGDRTMTAVIEIQYQGPSEKFAWLIPMPGKPEIQVASTFALDRLQDATTPSYELEVTVEGTCANLSGGGFGGGAGGAAGSFGGDEDGGVAGPEGIGIVDRGTVGPYEYTTISVDPSLDEPAETAIDWFRDNGYDLSGVDAEVLGPYLADGLNLLAFKLTKQAQQEQGALRPVMLTYQGSSPGIPIRPTAVAAQPDMGVLVWVVAAARAVPMNYKSLILNDALIDWFDPLPGYRGVVTRAADEAGGQGFVTELAGPSAAVAEAVWSGAELRQLEELEDRQFDDPLDLLWEANWMFRGWEGWREAVEAAVQLPDGVSLDEFAQNPDAYRGTAQIDAAAFIAALREKVIDPIARTQEAIGSRPYITRLFTTLSAEEMTTDPVFIYNWDLPDLSNRHVARQYIQCSPDLFQSEAPWRVVLPQGDVVYGSGSSWPIGPSMLPANRAIEQLSNAGMGEVLIDNAEAIERALDALPKPTGSTPRPGPDDGADPASADDGDGDDGCAVRAPGSRAGFPALGCAGLLLALARRRLVR